MLLFLEIYFTVRAWGRGWGAGALLPWVIIWPIGMAIGASLGPDGAATAFGIGLALDFLLIGILSAMAGSAPRSEAPRPSATALEETSPTDRGMAV